jgi:protein phosphatase
MTVVLQSCYQNESSRMDGHEPRPWEAFHNRKLSGRGWCAYGESRAGTARTANEDNYILVPLAHDRLLVAVADGLGGHNAGQIASRLACETLFDAACNGTLDRHDDSDQGVLQALESTILNAHQRIAMWSTDIEAFEGMGCTLTAAIIAAHRVWYCHVGDSRLYHISGTTCQQITDDQIVTAGNVRDGQPISLKEERRGGDLLVQALGIEDKHSRLTLQQGAIALRLGDALLLCTDGVHGSLVEHGLADFVRSDGAIGVGVHQFIEASLAAGSSDDITAVLVAMAPDSRTR